MTKTSKTSQMSLQHLPSAPTQLEVYSQGIQEIPHAPFPPRSSIILPVTFQTWVHIPNHIL
jgi:hypothetical protein